MMHQGLSVLYKAQAALMFIEIVNFISGIKRKRIRGDLWHYKNICEEVFSNTHL